MVYVISMFLIFPLQAIPFNVLIMLFCTQVSNMASHGVSGGAFLIKLILKGNYYQLLSPWARNSWYKDVSVMKVILKLEEWNQRAREGNCGGNGVFVRTLLIGGKLWNYMFCLKGSWPNWCRPSSFQEKQEVGLFNVSILYFEKLKTKSVNKNNANIMSINKLPIACFSL